MLSGEGLPKHIGIIMDGNGRWARARFLPRSEGHRAGAKTVRMAVEECVRHGVPYLTLYAFSAENWLRPESEIKLLMSLLEHYLQSEIPTFVEQGVRLRIIGEREKLSERLQEALKQAETATEAGSKLTLTLAISYGGRQEIARACRALAEAVQRGELRADQITEAAISERLFAPDIPDPDLIIRTSNEIRTSNFLLWQSAYAEYIFTPVLWPDFSADDFARCIAEFQGRTRKFGKVLNEDAA